MNRQQQKNQVPMVGGSSLLVIFAVLCLTVFALLGFSTVQADKRLSDTSAKAVSDYYTADTQAEKILAELRAGNMPEEVRIVDGIYCYSCVISDTQELQVEVKFQDNVWEIQKWQAVSSVQWTEDDTLSLWDGKSKS